MENKAKLDFDQLTVGYEFAPSQFQLDAAGVSDYLKSVEDNSGLYTDGSLVPPMAVAARAMAALGESMVLPPGSIHVSQEFEFLSAAKIDDALTSLAKVSAKQSRSKFRILTIELNVLSGQKVIATGKTGFILPV